LLLQYHGKNTYHPTMTPNRKYFILWY
jgi:hypothetical protein